MRAADVEWPHHGTRLQCFTHHPSQALPDIISDAFLATLRAYGVTAAYLFGSFARGEEQPGSDIDLFVTFAQPTSLFRQIDLAEALTRLSGRHVDLMTRIAPAFAPYMLPTLVPLPL